MLAVDKSAFTSIIQPPSSLAKQTDSDLEDIARQILGQIKQDVTSTQDIIPKWDIPYVSVLNAPLLYQTFGEKLVKYSQLILQIDKIRKATSLATSRLKDLTYPIASERLAVTKFGVGECDETTTLARIRCCLSGQRCFGILVSDAQKYKRNNPSAHCFVLMGIGVDEFDKSVEKNNNTFIEVIKRLKNGVLLDPFLNLVCSLKELESKGTDLFKYFDNYNIKYINQSFFLDFQDYPIALQIEQDACRIYEEAQKILQKEVLSQSSDERVFQKIVLNYFAQDIIKELNTICPDQRITWKKNCENNLKIWAEGFLEPITQLKDKLEKLGIKFTFKAIAPADKNSEIEEKYAVFLTNPSLDQLR